jgi:hypothetical protein
MAPRSGLVSFALVLIPTSALITFQILSPELDEALSNDYYGKIAAYSVAIVAGLIMSIRYSVVHDHEYRRSKAIGALSKTYKLEDRGLWDKGEVAIQKLEARAYSDFKGRKAFTSRQRMQGKIGQINRESVESNHNPKEHQQFPISVDGIEQKLESTEEQTQPKQNIIDRVSLFLSDSIERTATRRAERRKREESQKDPIYTSFEQDDDSRWSIPKGTQKKAIYCNHCSIYNEADTNYCSSCGSLIS